MLHHLIPATVVAGSILIFTLPKKIGTFRVHLFV